MVDRERIAAAAGRDDLRRRQVQFTVIGAVIGLLLFISTDLGHDSANRAFTVASLLAFGVGGALFFLGATPTRHGFAAMIAVTAALLAGGLYCWAELRFDGESTPPTFEVLSLHLFPSAAAVLLTAPFVHTGGQPRFAAEGVDAWQRQLWNAPFRLGIVQAFVGVICLVALLSALLFKLVGIGVFAAAFSEPLVIFVGIGAVWGFGFAALESRDQLLDGVRRLCLSLLSILTPVLAGLGLLFAATLPFTSLEPLWRTTRATPVLLALVSAGILVVNARAFDAKERSPAVSALVAAFVLVLPVFASLALYSTGLRVDQYGWTPARLAAIQLGATLGIVTLAYAFAVVRWRWQWELGLRCLNRPLAAAVIAIAIVVQTPLLDPHRITAADQLDRLRSGATAVAEFDFGYLRFKGGRRGQEALEAIRANPDLGSRADVRVALAEVDAAGFYEAWRTRLARVEETESRADVLDQRVVRRPTDLVVSDALKAVLVGSEKYALTACRESPAARCALVAVDVTDADAPEFAWIFAHLGSDAYLSIKVYRHEDDRWTNAYAAPFLLGTDASAAWRAIEAGDIGAVEPTHRNLRFGSTLIDLDQVQP